MPQPKLVALDCETTGLDLWHGAKPYLVTTCDESGNLAYWEWPVDPLTREPSIVPDDLEEIRELIRSADQLVLQNPKFDFAALRSIGIWGEGEDYATWPKVRDTLLAGHLLASNAPHDLTSMALVYLGVDIEPLEKALEKACRAARKLAERDYPGWQLAAKGRQDMPSAREKTWKYDAWLPSALAAAKGYPTDHEWYTVTSDYANADSSTTVALYIKQKEELKRRGLDRIYAERLKLLPIAYRMENRGITVSKKRHSEQRKEFGNRVAELGTTMQKIAYAHGGYELSLPKGASVNKSLRTFVFDTLGLKPIRNPKAKTDAPSLDAKNAIPYYLDTLRPGSVPHEFIKALAARRTFGTALGYLDSYAQYWLPIDRAKQWFVLHPSLNPTGTDTLRWSCSNPNAQQIGKKAEANIRHGFGPAPGREWWSLDAKNIELRIPAYECGEQELIDLFERADEPPYYGSEHLLNFSTVYPDIWAEELAAVGIEKVGPHIKKKYASTWYQRCKNGDFAVGYGAVDRPDGAGTADRTFGRPGSHARLKSRFAKKEKLNQYYIAQAERFGYVETLPDRTVDPSRGYPLLCSRSDWGRILPTVPLNYHVQGTACWVLGRMMVATEAYLAELNRAEGAENYWLIMQIHDELVLDFPAVPNQGNLDKIVALKTKLDRIGEDLVPAVPTPLGIEYHPDTWAEGIAIAA